MAASEFGMRAGARSFGKRRDPARTPNPHCTLGHESEIDLLNSFLEEARLLGVKVLPPCVMQSGVAYSLEDVAGTDGGGESAIRVPLSQVENVSPQRAARLVLERALSPFGSLDDLFRRVDLAPDAWDGLARSGARSVFGSRREVLWHLGRLQKLAPKKRSEQLAFDDLELPRDHVLLQVPSVEHSASWDFATMNLSTGPHPLALKRALLGKLGAKPLRELFALPPGETVLVAGSVISRQRPPTAKGFCFLILEDESGRLPIALPPHLYERFERVLREPALVLEGRLEAPPEEKRGGKTGVYRSVLIERMWAFDALLQNTLPLHGVTGLPGQSPRVAPLQERSARIEAKRA